MLPLSGDLNAEVNSLGLALSILLAAIGAVLIWGVDATAAGVDVSSVGWICLFVAAAGGVSTMFWPSWTSSRGRDRAFTER